MRKVAVVFMLALMTGTTARGAVLSLRVSGSPDATALTLAVSETAAIEIILDLEEFEVAGAANIFLDTVQTAPAGDVDGEAFEVLSVLRAGDPDFIWTNKRSFIVPPMDDLEFEDLSPGEGISLDDLGYHLVAAMAEGDWLGGGTGTPHVLDRIIIHGTAPGTIEVTFEEIPRPPRVFESSAGLDVAFDLGLGDYGRDGGPAVRRDPRPLIVTVTEAGTGDDEPPPGGDDDPGPVADPGPGDDDTGDDGQAVEPADDDDSAASDEDDGGADDQPGDGDDTATDEPGDADGPGDDVDQPADDGDEASDDAVDAAPGTDEESGETEGEDRNDSATTTARLCGFGAVGGFFMCFLGLFALRPQWGRSRMAP